MQINSKRFKAVDMIYILMMILPVVFLMVLKILTNAPSDGINVTGARIFFEIPMPFQNLPITESQINSWAVMIMILGLCLYLTHGISVKAETKRQHLAEWIVEKTDNLVRANMGEYFMAFSPFIGAIIALSAFSSLICLFGQYSPTADINVVSGWAILTFILITYYKFKCGPLSYIKSFGDPVPLLAPLNIISEVATPISMAFRHYGNILSGSVIGVLVAAALQGLSSIVLGWLPGFLGEFPFLQIGLPAVLSIYFDVFSGCLQAFIFAMLTMLYVAGAFPMEEYFRRKNKKQSKAISN